MQQRKALARVEYSEPMERAIDEALNGTMETESLDHHLALIITFRPVDNELYEQKRRVIAVGHRHEAAVRRPEAKECRNQR